MSLLDEPDARWNSRLDPGTPGEVAVADVVLVDHRGAPGTCRRAALDDARAALNTVAAPSATGALGEARVVLRAYDLGEGGRGGLVVALGGRFDDAAAEHLRGYCAELRRCASTELILECSGLSTGCHPELARAVARLRLQALVDGLRVELHQAPAAVLAELGHHHRDTPAAEPIAASDVTESATTDTTTGAAAGAAR